MDAMYGENCAVRQELGNRFNKVKVHGAHDKEVHSKLGEKHSFPTFFPLNGGVPKDLSLELSVARRIFRIPIKAEFSSSLSLSQKVGVNGKWRHFTQGQFIAIRILNSSRGQLVRRQEWERKRITSVRTDYSTVIVMIQGFFICTAINDRKERVFCVGREVRTTMDELNAFLPSIDMDKRVSKSDFVFEIAFDVQRVRMIHDCSKAACTIHPESLDITHRCQSQSTLLHRRSGYPPHKG